MASDISKRILAGFPKFSKSHKKIANAVLNDYAKISDLTAIRLARTVGVSESTVVRFAYALGYEGYSEFQRAIGELVKTKLTPNQRIEMTKKRIGRKDIIENVMESDIQKIRFTLESLNRDSFYSSVDAILDAKNIYIMGARSAEPVARMLNYNLSLIFDNVRFVQATSSGEVFEQMFSIGSDDVLIAFSFPRYSTKVVNAVKFANNKGAKVIVVTDSQASPLVEHATYVLTAQSDMAAFMDSLVAPASIINAIIVEITHKREKDITDRFDKLEELWDEYDVYTKR